MSTSQRPIRQTRRGAGRRIGPLLGVFLVIAGTAGALSPIAPTARGEEVSPPPSVEPSQTPAPTAGVSPTPDTTQAPSPTAKPTLPVEPSPTPDPTEAPSATTTPSATPGATVDPSAGPSPTPSASATPGATVDPSATPAATPDASAEPSASPEPTPDASAEPSASPEPTPSPVPGEARVLHSWINSVDDQGRLLFEGPLDSPLDGAERFTVYRVRFQIANQGDLETVITPALEVQGVNGWQSMPLVDPERGTPFYGASDDGRVFRPRTQKIAADALRLTDEGATAIAGRSSAGIALSEVVLPAHTYTEVEFAVRATIDAEWGERYVFRLTDGAEVVPGEHSAMLLMNPKPGIELSPGQRQGRGIKDPVPLYRLDPSVALTDLPSGGTPLAASIASVTFNLRGPIAAPAVPTTPHLVEGLTSDTCAACHAAHDAQGMMLQQQPDPQSGTCFTCHDGTGALSDVRSDWANPSLPANDPDTSSYYSHPATSATSGHVSGTEDEFAGVLNRHAVCADCHQPHLADSGRTAQSTSGWTASGAIQAPGVGVTNGAAGEAPAYEWKQIATLEYELCLKCHSGYTELPEQDPAHPSRWALDKAIELNPANTSYHPVEAAGTNQTSAMAASLAGTSPYKLWAFETDEMVRCVNCHGDSDNLTPANPPAANARSDNHASENRGILLAPYRDRDLKSVADQYGAEDFALCYLCHAEAPMVDDSADRRTDTNFSWHGYHMFDIAGNGTGGTDIDTPGAGAGNAVCAECHFRTHGTALATGIQAQAPRLVNFAPNVRPVGGILRFSPAGSGTLGSCTLNCHGKTHVNYLYDGAVEP